MYHVDSREMLEGYGMPPLEVFHGYTNGIEVLKKTTRVFPDPSQLLLLGRKVLVNALLNRAAKMLGNDRPRHTVMARTPTWQEYQAMREEPPVLEAWKREFSDESLHVLLPFKEGRKDQETFEKMLKKESNWIPFHSEVLRPQWLKQPLITPLRFLGEVRSYVVQGVFYYAVHSMPNGVDLQFFYTTHNLRPLELME